MTLIWPPFSCVSGILSEARRSSARRLSLLLLVAVGGVSCSPPAGNLWRDVGMVTLPSPGSYSLAIRGKRTESTPILISVHISFSIDGISGSAVVGFSAAEGRLTGWLLAEMHPQSFPITSFSPHARAAASQSQLSRGDGGVTPWTSRQFITGGWETNNQLHSTPTATTIVKHFLGLFKQDLLFIFLFVFYKMWQFNEDSL